MSRLDWDNSVMLTSLVATVTWSRHPHSGSVLSRRTEDTKGEVMVCETEQVVVVVGVECCVVLPHCQR